MRQVFAALAVGVAAAGCDLSYQFSLEERSTPAFMVPQTDQQILEAAKRIGLPPEAQAEMVRNMKAMREKPEPAVQRQLNIFAALGCEPVHDLHTKISYAGARGASGSWNALQLACGNGEAFEREGKVDCDSGKVTLAKPSDGVAPETPAAQAARQTLCRRTPQ